MSFAAIISNEKRLSKKKWLVFSLREAELHDEMPRLKSAREEGTHDTAKNFLILGLDVDMVAKGTGLSIEVVEKIKKELN